MAALPRLSRFFAPVLPSSGVRRTFTLLYTPMRTDQAARDIRKKKIEYISDAAQRQRIGQIENAQQSAEYDDVLQQEADLTAGHGILRTTGLTAVSAQDPTSWNALSPTLSKQPSRHRVRCVGSGPAGPGVLRRRPPTLSMRLTRVGHSRRGVGRNFHLSGRIESALRT
jgi:hypothetical protein